MYKFTQGFGILHFITFQISILLLEIKKSFNNKFNHVDNIAIKYMSRSFVWV